MCQIWLINYYINLVCTILNFALGKVNRLNVVKLSILCETYITQFKNKILHFPHRALPYTKNIAQNNKQFPPKMNSFNIKIIHHNAIRILINIFNFSFEINICK